MFLKKYLHFLFFLLIFLGLASYLACANGAAYARFASPAGGFSAGLFHSKKIITVQRNRLIVKHFPFSALFGTSGVHLNKILSACGMECQNILAKISNPINETNEIFVIILLLCLFVQKLLVFPVNHPPKRLPV